MYDTWDLWILWSSNLWSNWSGGIEIWNGRAPFLFSFHVSSYFLVSSMTWSTDLCCYYYAALLFLSLNKSKNLWSLNVDLKPAKWFLHLDFTLLEDVSVSILIQSINRNSFSSDTNSLSRVAQNSTSTEKPLYKQTTSAKNPVRRERNRSFRALRFYSTI